MWFPGTEWQGGGGDGEGAREGDWDRGLGTGVGMGTGAGRETGTGTRTGTGRWAADGSPPELRLRSLLPGRDSALSGTCVQNRTWPARATHTPFRAFRTCGGLSVGFTREVSTWPSWHLSLSWVGLARRNPHPLPGAHGSPGPATALSACALLVCELLSLRLCRASSSTVWRDGHRVGAGGPRWAP